MNKVGKYGIKSNGSYFAAGGKQKASAKTGNPVGHAAKIE